MEPRHQVASPDGTRPDAASPVAVRYWAGARAAAGVDGDTFDAPGTVGALVAAMAAAHPALGAVLPVCSILVDGLAATPDDPVPPGAVVEVLPPFAGG
ncbi:MoaD/ThiS family protein [uncultured Phycicoccus sp.]|uniref:MoaD/ThiS family protein n=1 Tax=uncultured Phycicoccus sp. TaxID=661422 RepID=UPI002632E3A3|nr:MoaD/ThiS family protein [uncultured Phycicoccus sp.]